MGRSPVVVVAAVIVLLLLAGCSSSDAPLTGQATHGTYTAFSVPEQGFRVGNGMVLVSDSAVYKNAWFSVNGSAWQQFTLSGSAYGSSSSWLAGAGSVALPASLSGLGEHYLIVYSCTWSSEAWDCHGGMPGAGGWQLQVMTISSASCGGSTCAPEEYCSAQDVCLLSVSGNTYFVAVEGNDSSPGNFTHPWGTWQKAFETADAGDIVYFRGGIWMPVSKPYDGFPITSIDPSLGRGHNGTEAEPIIFEAYPPDFLAGNFPILDGSLASENDSGNTGLSVSHATHLKFKGLTIRNVLQLADGARVNTGFAGFTVGTIWIENMHVHHIGGEGVWFRGYDYIHLKNCDSHDNGDWASIPPHTPGGQGDGFLLSSRATGIADAYKTAYVSGCRAWNNGDDGFDLNVQELYMDDCWAFNNGYPVVGGPGGDGIKTNTGLVTDPDKKTFRNCITAFNQAPTGGGAGLYFTNFETGLGTVLSYHNCLSYRDDRATASFTPSSTNFNVDWFNNVFVNNIAFQTTASYIASFDAAGGSFLTYPYAHLTTNTFRVDPESITGKCQANPDFTLSAEDFVALPANATVCGAVLGAPRKADGSLPDLRGYFHLAPGSDLIDGGTLIPGFHCSTLGEHPGEDCRVWYGSAPDLGPFEYEG